MRTHQIPSWKLNSRSAPLLFSLLIAGATFIGPLHGQAKSGEKNRLAQKVESYRAAGHTFESIKLFEGSPALLASRAQLKKLVTEAAIVTVNEALAEKLLKKSVGQFTLPLPTGEQLDLIETDFSGTRIEGPEGEDLSHTLTARHFQGVIKGNPLSFAAISVARDPKSGKYEMMGTFSTRTGGNTIIGKLKGDNPNAEHAIYSESKLVTAPPVVECGHQFDGFQVPTHVTPEILLAEAESSMSRSNEAAVAGACVRIHMEVENDVYLVQGANTTNYATGFYNIAQAVYANENIPIKLNYLKIWTTPGPEQNVVGYDWIWNAFWNRKSREGIQGDLAMLVGLHVDRGIASLNTICGPEYNRCGVSPIRDYPSYPTYSWASATFPHEIGHLFGSPHTQGCSWNGNNTALDGCVAPEGSCARPSNMVGTIMSYCGSSTFSLANGFGTQPGNLIRNSFNNATCLIACSGGTTDTTPPTVSLSAPANGATVSGTATLSASASDNVGVSRVEFYVDGTLVLSDTTAPYSTTWNTTSAANGSHTLMARAFDAAGNTTSSSVTVTVNNGTNPTGALTNNVPVTINGAQGTQSQFYIDVPSGAKNLVIAMSGGTGDGDLYTRFNTVPTTSTYDCRPYLSGNNESCTVATPSAGRYYAMVYGYSAFSGTTLKASYTSGSSTDTVAPTVSLTAPASDATVTGNATLSASASDNVGVSRVEFLVDGVVVGTDTTSPFSLTWASSNVANGGHALAAKAYDAAGNVGTSASRNITVSNTSTACTPVSGSQLVVGTLHCVPAGSGTQYLYCVVPTGKTQVTVTTSGGTGNGDLYVSPTSWADTANYTQRSVNAGNSETLTTAVPTGTYYFYISVVGTQSGMNIRLTAQ